MKGGFEVAIDADVDVLIEAGVRFEAGFGLLVGLENTEIMLEEADSPFEGFASVGMFQSMGTALGEFDDFAVGYAGLRPGLGEVVGIELEHAGTVGTTTDNNMFAAFVALFEFIHSAPEGIIARNRHEIAHSFGVNRSGRREFDEGCTSARQTDHYRCF